MASKLKDVLARIVSELEDEEVRDEFEALKGKKLTYAELLETIREAPAEERAQLRQILLEEGVGPGAGNDEPPPPKKDEPPPKDEPPTEPKSGPQRRKRPGRKSGSAYDWYVDEETSEVVRSPVAVIYSGEDEPDEVEMLDLEPVPTDAEVEKE